MPDERRSKGVQPEKGAISLVFLVLLVVPK
jgi:hypothetical protein